MTLFANSKEGGPVAADSDPDGGSIFTAYRRTQFFVLLASALSLLLFWFGGAIVHLPSEPGYSAGVLQQPGWVLDLICVYVLLAATVVIGSVIGGRFWYFAGLFAGVTGLMAISLRGGPMRYVLFDAASRANTRGVFLQLLVEQCLLFAPVAMIWSVFWRRYEAATSKPEATDDVLKPPAAPPILGVAVQIIVTGFIVWLLAATDAKKQVLVGVFLGGLGGAIAADNISPHPKAAAWYWIGPFIVGAIGYALAYVNAPGWTTGSPFGMFASLARPLPLDYASAGCAGVLIGYWISAERPHVRFSFRPAPPEPSDSPGHANR
ncbi:MAG TPA: hypothetical protein VLJ39_15445 [Tepidisphaeraceae bacterium]|nr:hypothetical protein [Tepidisphaeraceae bacterium]